MIIACGSNKFDVDVSGIKVEIDIKRLDKDIMVNYPDTPDVIKLNNNYGEFLELYSIYIIQAGDVYQRDFALNLMDFNKYCHEFRIPGKVDEIFGDLSGLKKGLTEAFQYYKYYFPEKKVPQVYTYLSNFSISVVTDESGLGIGLDKYLGTNCELYKNLGLENYKIAKMHKEMLPIDCMRAFAQSDFPYNDSVNNMVNQMVYEGKIQYFIDAMFPFAPDSLKFGYSQQQFEWADNNEREMWTYLVEHELLFSSDELSIRKMISDGPFTTLFANNSAPRAGAYLGWKIVHRYMEKNPGVSFADLMKNDDYQGILNAASYKP